MAPPSGCRSGEPRTKTIATRDPSADGVVVGRLCAVAALELLARTAPARIVSADVLLLRLHERARRDRCRHRAAAADSGCRAAGHRAGPRRRDRRGARDRLVLVAEVAVPAPVARLLESGCVGRLDLEVEEVRDDLLADSEVQLLEQDRALVA